MPYKDPVKQQIARDKWRSKNRDKERKQNLDRYHKQNIRLDRRNRIREHKAVLVEFLGGKCFDCGKTFPNCCYHFHHINSNTKSFNLGHRMCSKIDVLKEEASKCVLLCANCHAVRTYGDEEISLKISTGKGIVRAERQTTPVLVQQV